MTVPGGRRVQILSAAARLFDERGYSRTSMEELAEEVGISKPTIYHYFDSKWNILEEIHREFLSLLLAKFDRRAAMRPPPDVALFGVIFDIIDLMFTHRNHVRVFFREHRELPPEPFAHVSAQRDDYFARVHRIVVIGIEQGVFRHLSPRLDVLAIFGMCNWAYQWLNPEGDLDAYSIARAMWNLVMLGLLPRRDSHEIAPVALQDWIGDPVLV